MPEVDSAEQFPSPRDYWTPPKKRYSWDALFDRADCLQIPSSYEPPNSSLIELQELGAYRPSDPSVAGGSKSVIKKSTSHQTKYPAITATAAIGPKAMDTKSIVCSVGTRPPKNASQIAPANNDNVVMAPKINARVCLRVMISMLSFIDL
jgi:hypothetical protein